MNLRLLRGRILNPAPIFWTYLLLISVAEVLVAVQYVRTGFVLHTLLLIGLVLHAALGTRDDTRKLALGLTLAPLIRLLSLSLPIVRLPQAWWYPVVAVPLLLTTWGIIRHAKLERQALALRCGNVWLQMLLVGGGFGLGTIEYTLLRPQMFEPSLALSAI